MAGKRNDRADAPSDPNGSAKKLPVKRIYYSVFGGSLSVSVWDKVLQLKDGDRTVYSVSVQRSYEENGARKWTNYLRESDLPVAVIALEDAYREINRLKQPVQAPAPATEEIPF